MPLFKQLGVDCFAHISRYVWAGIWSLWAFILHENCC